MFRLRRKRLGGLLMGSRNLVKHRGLIDGKRGALAQDGGFLYAGIPMSLARDVKLSANARSVALLIWSHDEKWQQSVADIAKSLGMGRNTVAAALSELEERRWMIREIHYKPGKKVERVWDFEIWHLQMSNIPFSPSEVERIKDLPAPNQSRSNDIPAPNQSRGCSEPEQVPALNESTIGMQREMHLSEMHLSNASSTKDEQSFGGSALAVEDPEATEEPEGDRPSGLNTLQPSTAEGSAFADPFCRESLRQREELAADALAREERAAELLQPSTAGGPPASAWTTE